MIGRTEAIQAAKMRKHGVTTEHFAQEAPELFARFGLTEYFQKRNLTIGVHGISSGLSRIQAVCKLMMHSYSGMRDEEAGSILCSGMSSHLHNDRLHYSFVGLTWKMNGGRAKKARWITNSEGARAFRVAFSIAKLCRQTAAKKIDNLLSLANTPLFISVAYLGLLGPFPSGGCKRMLTSKFAFGNSHELRTLLQPLILESDIEELEKIDPHRAWRMEPPFQLNVPWSLTTHQLRRSLALYAQRSGLVSLPSLRRQLQHLTEEMSRYYAKGSAFADNFIGNNKKHFGFEWREVQPVSSALGYLALLTSGEPLFGAHGAWIEKRLRAGNDEAAVDRSKTLSRFKNGELAYRETFMGGCTSTEPCRLQPLQWLNLDCLQGCKHMVGRLSSLTRVISVQTRLVSRLVIGSAEHRQESADLTLLLNVKSKIMRELQIDVNAAAS